MTPDEIAKDRAVCDAATEGPWTIDERRPGRRNGIQRLVVDGDICRPVRLGIDGGENNRANIEFASRARTRWPAALDEVEKLTGMVIAANEVSIRAYKERDQLRKQVTAWRAAAEAAKDSANTRSWEPFEAAYKAARALDDSETEDVAEEVLGE